MLARKPMQPICELKWEDTEKVRGEGIKFDVKRVKASKQERKKGKMTLFGKFVMEGNEAADWLAKAGADLDGGAFAKIKAATVRP